MNCATNEVVLSVVIVNYNSGDLLAQCVESIEAAAGHAESEIVIVDNNSEDDSLQRLPITKSALVIIRNTFNAGFPRACNQGIRVANGELILLLNPDARVEASTLSALKEGLQCYPSVGICTVSHSDGKQAYAPCYEFPSLGTYLRNHFLRQATGAKLVALTQRSQLRWFVVKGYVSGACLAITRETIDRIGLMDESLFWAEDADWCKRAYDRGIEIAYCDEATVFHHRSAIARKHLDIALYYQYTSKPRYARKHGSAASAVVLKGVITIEVLLKWLVTWLSPLGPWPVQQIEARVRAYRAVLNRLWLSAPAPWEGERT